MDQVTKEARSVEVALDSLGVTAMRVKEERDSLLMAAKAFVNLINNTSLVFDAKQIQWLQRKPAYEHLCDAIERAEQP